MQRVLKYFSRHILKHQERTVYSGKNPGYSRLLGEDAEGTIRTLGVYLEAMTGFIREHRGRVVSTAGDRVLAEFANAVGAVRCAVEIQEELKERNKELPENRRMEFRVGINLGDVVEEGDTLYGDGVNIAAHLESLSEAGGICISGMVHDHIKNKLALEYEYIGEQTVKNIQEPVRVYKILEESPASMSRLKQWKKTGVRYWKKVPTVFKALMAIIAAVNAINVMWQLYPRIIKPTEVASKARMAFPLPDKPSIAVLPFANMSEDPKQEFFSNGITEDIITALSKVPNLFVIARNSTFTYKGKPVKVKQVSEELGVRYVLEGSIQKSGNKVRITAQLIDALTGHHLWAERYDRDLKDIFALQDEITFKILVAMQVKLTEGVQALVHAKGTKNLDAYLICIEGRELMLRLNKAENVLARQKCEEAIALDPRYATTYGILATVYLMDRAYGVSPQESLEKAHAMAQKALALDNTQAYAYQALSFVYVFKRRYEEALAASERAVELEPNSAGAHINLGRTLDYICRHEEAVKSLKKAIRMNPFPPSPYYHHLGFAYFNLGKYEEAVTAYKKAIDISPNNQFAHQGLAAAYAQLGRSEEAGFEAQEVLRVNPQFSTKAYIERANWKEPAIRERWLAALQKAGLK